MKTVLALSLALVSSGCTVAHVVDSWKPDGAQPFKRSNKRVVVVLANDAEKRDRAEEKLASSLKNATQLRSLFSAQELEDGVAVKAKLLEQGFSELVVVRTEEEKEKTRRRGSIWERWLSVGVPYASTTRVDLVTSVYDIASGDLRWQLSSYSYDPSSVESLLGEHVKAGLEQLQADGMLVD
ncbi:MAG: hypothetical protein ACO1OB_21155 [Archangium sp.]